MLIAEKCKLLGLTGLVAAVALPALGALTDTPSSITTHTIDAIEGALTRYWRDVYYYWSRGGLIAPPAVVKVYEEVKSGAIEVYDDAKGALTAPKNPSPKRSGR